VHLIGRARFQTRDQMKVELARLIGFDVNEKTPTPDLIADFHKPRDDILQQAGPEATTLVSLINAESRKQRHGLRITTSAFPQARGCVLDS